jgi:hypothetical protein
LPLNPEQLVYHLMQADTYGSVLTDKFDITGVENVIDIFS